MPCFGTDEADALQREILSQELGVQFTGNLHYDTVRATFADIGQSESAA